MAMTWAEANDLVKATVSLMTVVKENRSLGEDRGLEP